MAKRFVFTVGASILGAALGATMWAGCGGSQSSGNPPDAGMDSSHPPQDSGNDSAMAQDAPADVAQPMDAGKDAPHQVIDSGPLMCGTTVCGAGTECCAIPVPPPAPDGGADGGGDAGDAGGGGLGSFTFQCLASCPDGGAPIQCNSPQQCGADAGGTICCGTLVLGGAGTSCSVDSVSSACQSSCQTNISTQPLCPATDTVQFCAQVADCTDPNFPACCTFNFQGQDETFCISSSEAALATQFLGVHCLQ